MDEKTAIIDRVDPKSFNIQLYSFISCARSVDPETASARQYVSS